MVRWEEPAWVKIHEGCGGRIRWIEAINTPGVGYTGHCDGCGQGRVVVEEMIPIEVRGEEPGFNGKFDVREQVFDHVLYDERGKLAGLEWDESLSFDENQRQIRGVILGEDIRTDGGQVARCRECGAELGAGYLCDDCDTVEGWE